MTWHVQPLFFFYFFYPSVPLWLLHLFSPVLPSLCLLHLFPPVLPRNIIGKIPWIDGLIDQFSSGKFLMTSIICLFYKFFSPLLSQDKMLTTCFSQSMQLLLCQKPEVAQMILFILINFAYCLTIMPSVISDIFYLSQTSFGHISINSSTILMVLMATKSPQKRPFDRCQSCLEAINIGWDIKQINW